MALGSIGACCSTEIVNNIASFWRRTITKFVTKVIALHTINARTLFIWMPEFTAAFRAMTVVRKTRWSPVYVQKTAKNWQKYCNSFHTAEAPPLCIFTCTLFTTGAVAQFTWLQLPLPPQRNNDEDEKEQKRAILASLKWKEKGWSRYSIYFVQDCGMSGQVERESCALIDYPSRGKMELSCRSGYGLCTARKIYHFLVFYPIYIGWILASLFFLRVYGPRRSRSP